MGNYQSSQFMKDVAKVAMKKLSSENTVVDVTGLRLLPTNGTSDYCRFNGNKKANSSNATCLNLGFWKSPWMGSARPCNGRIRVCAKAHGFCLHIMESESSVIGLLSTVHPLVKVSR